jgi:hypothetical protein
MKNSAWVLSLLSNALVATLHAANRPTAPSGHFTRRPRLYPIPLVSVSPPQPINGGAWGPFR